MKQEQKGTLRKLSYTEAIAEALVQAMERNDRVFVMGEGVDNVTGIYGTILPAFKRFGDKRVIDTPISENGLTGFAIGAAIDGMRPILFHQRNDFMLLSMDQLVNEAAKIRFMSAEKHRIPLTVVSFVARKIGEGAQHSQSLQATFAHIPGLKVVMPTNPFNAKGLLITAIFDDDPVIVLYHRALFEEKADVPEKIYELPLGQSRLERSGGDITIVAVSAAIKDAIEAADWLQTNRNIEAEVIDLISISPLDKGMIIKSVKKTGRLLVIDTGWKSFGASAEILALVAEEAYYFLKTAPRRIALPDVPAPATPYLLKHYYPTANDIMVSALEMMK